MVRFCPVRIFVTPLALVSPREVRGGGFAVALKRGRILAAGKPAEVRQRFPGAPVLEFEGGLMLPGLINPHCHLELEFCKGRVSYTGDFVEWLQQIRELKQEQAGRPVPVADSLRELLSSGVTTLCDHYTMEEEIPWEEIGRSGIRYFGFREVFQFNNHNPRLDESLGFPPRYSYAAHSPYTTSAEVAALTRRWARRMGRAYSTHLSEFPEELTFVERGEGEGIRRLIELAGADDPDFRGTGLSPIAYFHRLGILSRRTYAVHCNYLTPGDAWRLARSGATVVFCPNSHRYFGHRDYPLAELMVAGVRVAIGTDSLVSNRGLNLWDEVATARESFPMVRPEQWLTMVLSNGYQPLGITAKAGRLARGGLGDLAIYPYQGEARLETVFDYLVSEKPRTLATVVGGRVVLGAEVAQPATGP